MINAIISLQRRWPDDFGEGHFGASRGSRVHRGIDFYCPAGLPILSPVKGVVTKLGYPYGDDLSYLYVEITDDSNMRHRIFYCSPHVDSGDYIKRGDIVGQAQCIADRYNTEDKKMNNHIHYEIINGDGEYIDPDAFWSGQMFPTQEV